MIYLQFKSLPSTSKESSPVRGSPENQQYQWFLQKRLSGPGWLRSWASALYGGSIRGIENVLQKRYPHGVPSLEHKQAAQDIIKVRADLGRLGGLLKSALATIVAMSAIYAACCGRLKPGNAN